ncbi:PepSY-associated TM helix domain-containing protein [uncultured Paraglaciecola sp.]|uniref:PepSY-associated TM helix domain-containing protein n=1 Tax=uncultured Paraglaciecola sp. TaxID=1765024 RepID=UPI00259302D0|nr:PepSY-associated TM helix domain-containing protein [uncultured Paraglaciecola sp.]
MAKISNRLWFQLHGWMSLPIWILFCAVCLTGTIAVVSHELTWLTNSAARADNPNNLPSKTMAEITAIVENAYPNAKVSTVMNYEPYLVNTVIFTDSNKPYAIAYVNQYTGDIQEVNQGVTFIGFMRSLHAWLLFPWKTNYSIGYYLVSAMAITMLGALLTGLMVYKNFWRAFTQPKLRLNQGRKTALADLHRLAGVWSIWFILLMAVTGIWYLVQATLWHNDVEIDPHAPIISEIPSISIDGEVPKRPISLADALHIASTKYPDFKSTYILPPEHYRDTYKLYGEGDFIFFDQYSYGVVINPWNGEIMQVREPDKMNVLQTLSHIANPLHYGTIGGIWTKIIWFIFGVFLTGMSITGFLMWGNRTIQAVKKHKNDETSDNASSYSLNKQES